MANHKYEMTGMKIGLLTVIKYVETRNSQAYWLCKCVCGNTIVARGNHLRSGNIKSCGCLRGITNKERQKHGLSRDRIYYIYHGIRKRCTIPETASYQHYGGRGIKMCDEWLDSENGFDNFLKWALNNGYAENLSIDRIDVNGDYCPENCRWATTKEQANNRRTSVFYEFNNERHTLSEWADIIGVNRGMLDQRLRKGWPIEKVLTQERRRCHAKEEKTYKTS